MAHHHHDVDSVAGAVGTISGILGHYINITFDMFRILPNSFGRMFLSIGITGEDLHSFLMAAICAGIGFSVTKLMSHFSKKLFPEKK